MINTEQFGVRLRKIMEFYQLSSASLADEIGVQRSSISHLLSGRNKPSLDFVLKILDRYKEVELYWLMNGKGRFPKKETTTPSNTTLTKKTSKNTMNSDKSIDRIIIFYNDGTFENYIP